MKPLRSEMAFEILAYLVRHPRAQDTFEGILEGWLLERYIGRQRVAVEEAVGELVESGLVLSRERHDRRARYRLNPRRRDEAQTLVERRLGAGSAEV